MTTGTTVESLRENKWKYCSFLLFILLLLRTGTERSTAVEKGNGNNKDFLRNQEEKLSYTLPPDQEEFVKETEQVKEEEEEIDHKHVSVLEQISKETYKLQHRITNRVAGYYRENNPMIVSTQMTAEQYQYIGLLYMSIPHQNFDSTYTDARENYKKLSSHDVDEGKEKRPKMLFFGCGRDTKHWQKLKKFLDGEIQIVESSEEWFETCRTQNDLLEGKDIHFFKPNEELKMKDHNKLLLDLAQSLSLPTIPILNEELEKFEGKNVQINENVLKGAPFDVIVVDGPDAYTDLSPGRSVALYFSLRLILSYPKNHCVHLLLHDTTRMHEIIIANTMIGHDPKVYIGNMSPSKGLKHWRVCGQNAPMLPTKHIEAPRK